MKEIRFCDIINELSFSQRIISDYIKQLCDELVAGTKKENTAYVIEFLSKNLKELKDKIFEFKSLFQNKAKEFLDSKVYTNSLLKAVLKKDKNCKWTYQKNLMYPNPHPSDIKSAVIFIDSVLLLNKENQKSLRLIEQELLKILRTDDCDFTNVSLPLIELYQRLVNNQQMFLININNIEIDKNNLCWLEAAYDESQGKIKITPSIPTRYEESFNALANEEFDNFFEDKKSILITYKKFASDYLELAGDISNNDFEKILKRGL